MFLSAVVMALKSTGVGGESVGGGGGGWQGRGSGGRRGERGGTGQVLRGAEVTTVPPMVWGVKAVGRWGTSGVVAGRLGGSTGPRLGGGSVRVSYPLVMKRKENYF